MDVVFGGVVALFSAAIGAILTFWGSAQIEDRRWERENRARFHDRRLDVYTQYSMEANRIAHKFILEGSCNNADADAFLSVQARIILLGTLPVTRTVQQVSGFMDRLFHEEEAVAESEEAFWDEFNGRISAFHLAARAELGIPDDMNASES